MDFKHMNSWSVPDRHSMDWSSWRDWKCSPVNCKPLSTFEELGNQGAAILIDCVFADMNCLHHPSQQLTSLSPSGSAEMIGRPGLKKSWQCTVSLEVNEQTSVLPKWHQICSTTLGMESQLSCIWTLSWHDIRWLVQWPRHMHSSEWAEDGLNSLVASLHRMGEPWPPACWCRLLSLCCQSWLGELSVLSETVGVWGEQHSPPGRLYAEKKDMKKPFKSSSQGWNPQNLPAPDGTVEEGSGTEWPQYYSDGDRALSSLSNRLKRQPTQLSLLAFVVTLSEIGRWQIDPREATSRQTPKL